MTCIIAGDAACWQSGMAIDVDGAPTAYAPDGSGLVGLDYLPNAGHHGNWWALVCNASGVPIVQGPTDPAPGFYVSTTALVDKSKAATDPARYVDASAVPYVSVPHELVLRFGVHVGDVAMVVHNGVQCAAVVADVGPAGKYGEGSPALARALGIPSSARYKTEASGCSSGVSFVVFRNSRTSWPRSIADVDAQVGNLFTAWGGTSRLEVLWPVQAV